MQEWFSGDAGKIVLTNALLIGCATLSAVGDVFIFQWSRNQQWQSLVLGISVWVISLAMMGYLFRISAWSFSVVVVLLVVVHLLIDVGWDFFWLKTRLSLREWLGVCLTVVALFLLVTGRSGD
jgi:drug/metabolite transporter (DMT)-like permease